MANLDTNAKVIFGAYYDSRLKDRNLKVTVIATGFNGALSTGSGLNIPKLFSSDEGHAHPKTIPIRREMSNENEKESEVEAKEKQLEQKSEPWDIPAFLRKKKR